MNFPTNSGISGTVFKTKDIYYSNHASKETKFQEEIDNQSDSTDINTFMIGPVFGQNKSRLDIPCAIIQLINKKEFNGEKNICQHDIEKFKQFQKLLGMCVENTNELDYTIKVAFDVQDSMQGIESFMKQEEEREKDEANETEIKELFECLNSIK